MAGTIPPATRYEALLRDIQILFYANSGTVNAEGHGYVSLYLSCEASDEYSCISPLTHSAFVSRLPKRKKLPSMESEFSMLRQGIIGSMAESIAYRWVREGVYKFGFEVRRYVIM